MLPVFPSTATQVGEPFDIVAMVAEVPPGVMRKSVPDKGMADGARLPFTNDQN